jgi:eukaryotic-like serine/threonine-protein kinase
VVEVTRPRTGAAEAEQPAAAAPADHLAVAHGPLDGDRPELVDTAAHPTAVVAGFLAVLVLFLFAAAGWGAATGSGEQRAAVDRVVVDRVAGRPAAEAQAQLEREGLLVEIEFLANENTPEGIVFDQRPVAGAKVEVGAEVTLVVSDGPAGVVVPQLAGLQGADALRLLAALGVAATEAPTPDELIRPGEVIGTEPAAGVQLGGDQPVVVRISTGPAPRIVPEVVDAPVGVAMAYIGRAGLGIGRVQTTTRNDLPPGVVVSSDPAPGAEAPRGYPVSVTVTAEPGGVIVPPVAGLSRQNAERVLADSPLAVRFRTLSVPAGDPRAGRVVSQSMPAGTETSPGVPLELVVAVAPPPPTTTSTVPRATTTTPSSPTTTSPD